MKEKDFIPQFMKKYRSDCWWYKIPDNKFTGKKPFDVFGYHPVHKGLGGVSVAKPFAYEFKHHKTLQIWDTARVTPHQLESLKRVAEHGVEACIILGVHADLTPEQKKLYGYSKSTVNMSLVWPVDLFLAYKNRYTHFDVKEYLRNHNEDSISYVELKYGG